MGSEFQFGIWGVMRVGEPESDIVTITRATNDRRGWGYAIRGVNTVNPNNGKMAKEVVITANVIAPDAKESQPVQCTAPVHAVSGEWSAEHCPFAGQGTLVVNSVHPVVVASSERGRASVTGPVPTTPPVPASSEEIARAIETVKKEAAEEAPGRPEREAKNKGLIQFKGDRTPEATIAPVQPQQRPPGAEPILPNSREKAQSEQGLLPERTPPAEVHPPGH
jgi:hypothetical protein